MNEKNIEGQGCKQVNKIQYKAKSIYAKVFFFGCLIF